MVTPSCRSGLTSGGIVSSYRRNGIAFSSLTGRAGGLPNCLIKLKTLQQLSGRGGDTPKRFNEARKRAKEMLEKAAAVRMEIGPAGAVTITHKLSPSQIRHAARKPTR